MKFISLSLCDHVFYAVKSMLIQSVKRKKKTDKEEKCSPNGAKVHALATVLPEQEVTGG